MIVELEEEPMLVSRHILEFPTELGIELLLLRTKYPIAHYLKSKEPIDCRIIGLVNEEHKYYKFIEWLNQDSNHQIKNDINITAIDSVGIEADKYKLIECLPITSGYFIESITEFLIGPAMFKIKYELLTDI